MLSDWTGRKPMVVVACCLMSASMVGLGFATTASQVIIMGLIGGLGNGCYQAVDLALAVDTIPDLEESARYLGIWGVGAFVGVCLGPVIGSGSASIGHHRSGRRPSGAAADRWLRPVAADRRASTGRGGAAAGFDDAAAAPRIGVDRSRRRPRADAGAPLLYVFGQIEAPPPPANGQLGYIALFAYGSLAMFLSAAVLIHKVRVR